jgi:hypothetical protein
MPEFPMQWPELDWISIHTDLFWYKTFNLGNFKDDVNFEMQLPV